MKKKSMNKKRLEGVLLDEKIELPLDELSKACSRSEEWIIELVEEGVLDPIGPSASRTQSIQWRFSADSLQKAHIAMRLQRDLEINLSGVALALELLHEIETLKARLKHYESNN